MKLELLALKWAVVEKFRGYLLGSQFTVLTNSNPLCHLNTANLEGVEQRWVAQLAVFNFEICYHPGHCNIAADALSRRPGLDEVDVVAEDTEYDGCVAICSELHGGTAIDPDLAVFGPALGELTESKISPGSALGNTLTLPGYTKEELGRLQGADPLLKLLKHFWPTRKKPSARKRRELSRQVQSLLKQWGKLKEDEGLLYRVVGDVFLGECQQL
ncbi:Transposon Ty3-I Gag-Pol poly [Labeo rohita]|uniref:Transposon Ty3-I Gag-Pol poly n=1 Tax=Labeo rohita TaxID=84645 RepID=A0A498P3B2_LABRO|nr:Transposon Ty3-I Gag-Pol poly [Labeo rohita]